MTIAAENCLFYVSVSASACYRRLLPEACWSETPFNLRNLLLLFRYFVEHPHDGFLRTFKMQSRGRFGFLHPARSML
jgi:hypothetical protein